MVGTALRLLLLFVYVSACAVDGRRGNDVRDGYRGGGNYGDAAGDATGAGNRAWVSAAPRRRVLISSGKEADHPYGIVDEKAAHDEGTGASMLRDAVTAAVAVPTTTALLTETLPDGCEASVCPAEPYRKLGSVCVFGRLHPGAPAFVVPLNPKSSSSTVRTGFKRHGNGLTFEALCRLHDPLPHAVAQRLNVTGWSDIALAVVIREPMSRFVSAWNEITLRATLHVLHTEPPGYTMVRGFMWMRDEVKETLTKRGAINHRRADKSALEVLRTPEYFMRFQERYLQYVEHLNAPTSWDQDIHLAPQAVFMGVCSPQPLRARILIRMERLPDEMTEFLSQFAGATEAQDKALLDFFRTPPRERRSVSPDLLDVKKLREESAEHADLWRRVRGSVNMRADYLCTGYPVPPATPSAASGSAPILNDSTITNANSSSTTTTITITNSSSSHIQRHRRSRRHPPLPGAP